jgi:hypothetical protein
LRNVTVTGYHTGIMVYEHTDADNIVVAGNIHGLDFGTAHHASRFGRVGAYRNTHHVTVSGRHGFSIAQLNTEQPGPGQTTDQNKWQTLVSDVNDPQNLGIGDINYWVVEGNVGAVEKFTRNGGANISLRIAASRASATPAMAATDSLTVVIVSIEAGAAGAAPGEVRPLWARRSQANASRVASLRFGTFGRGIPVQPGNPGANQEFVVATNGAMTIVPRGRVEVRGDIMILNDSNYFRPPVGYYYNAYGIKLDTTGKFNDTTYLGRRTAPYPDRAISLYEADKTNPAPSVVFDSPRVIFAMASRLSADTIPDAKGSPAWKNYGFVRVNLQPKAGIEGRMGSATILEATLPPSIRGR